MSECSNNGDGHDLVGRVSRKAFLGTTSASLALLTGLGGTSVDEVLASVSAATRPKNGGQLLVSLSNESPNMDPHQASDYITAMIDANIFDTLVLTTSRHRVVPGLATNWTFSKDFKTVTLKLRHGVKFHDGAPFNAQAMKTSFDRMVSPNTKSEISATLLGPYEHSSVVDDHTIKVVFKEPYAPLLRSLSNVFCAPVSPKAIKKYGLGISTHPIGTGPFIFKEWIKGDHMTLVRNPHYRWAPPYFGVNGQASVESQTWKPVTEDAIRQITLQNGEANFVENFPPAFISKFRGNPKYAFDIETSAGLPFSFMINCQKAPTNELAVRQAMNYGIDKEQISKTLTFGVNKPAHGPLSPITFGYWKGVEKMYHYNPSKAKQLLDAAGWKVGHSGIREKNGKPLQVEFWTLSDIVSFQNVGVAFQGQMKAIGIDVKIVSLARAAWGAGVQQGKHNLTVQIFTFPDPSVLAINFASKNIGGQGFNWSRYSNSKLDSDMNEGAVTFNLAKRKALYQDAQKIIMENAILIPVYLWAEPFGRLAALKDIVYLEGGNPRFYPAFVA